MVVLESLKIDNGEDSHRKIIHYISKQIFVQHNNA